MNKSEEIKQIVKEKYADIAKEQSSGCCGPSGGCCGTAPELFNIMTDQYTSIEGYLPEADLGLGCGVPTEYAGIKKGDVVVDLGSGAGNDVFIARAEAGEEGKVVGVDMTPEMIEKAELNRKKIGYSNIEFRLGEIENLPVEDNYADVVISNCVLNLVPDKEKAFSEIYRTLKPGGHFCVSDIVLHGDLPEEVRKSAELYAGCVSGAMKEEEYLSVIKKNNFNNIEIKKSRKIELPEELLQKFLSPEGVLEYYGKNKGIYSITVVGVK
jgi:arsenite methyltransferase